MFTYAITQKAPTNAVVLARIDGDISDPQKSIAVDPSGLNDALTSFSFFEDYAFNIVLNKLETAGELGVGVANVESNKAKITNRASDPELGSPIPLFYKYEIDTLNILMPVDQARYATLEALVTPTPVELAELNESNNIIKSALIDRTRFIDLQGNHLQIKFNIEFTYVSNNVFDVVYFLPDSPKEMGPMYIVYVKNGSSIKSLIRSIPVFQRIYWNKGSVFFREQ